MYNLVLGEKLVVCHIINERHNPIAIDFSLNDEFPYLIYPSCVMRQRESDFRFGVETMSGYGVVD